MKLDLVRVAVLFAVLVAVTAFGLWRRHRDGRAQDVAGGLVLAAGDVGAGLGAHATLLQVSTRFCQPCRAARSVLAGVAASLPGVVHVEIDAEEHVNLIRRLDVVRTPTVLVLDARGRVVQRSSGVPARPQVLQALRDHLPSTPVGASGAH